MTFDEIINWVNIWSTLFGGWVDTISTSIGDIVGEDSLWSVILPSAIKNTTISGLMFTTAFTLFVGITLWKWAKQTIL